MSMQPFIKLDMMTDRVKHHGRSAKIRQFSHDYLLYDIDVCMTDYV